MGVLPDCRNHVLGRPILGQVKRHGLDSRTKLGILRLALFWHFFDIVWIAIFSVVYLGGLA